jgi:hypothetical protein
MMGELAKALGELHFDSSISAVIIASSEGKGFDGAQCLPQRGKWWLDDEYQNMGLRVE